MRQLANEKGIALVTALLLTLISLAIVLAVLYMVGQGTKMSAAHKGYKSALDASYGGGAEFFPKDVLPQMINSFTNYSVASVARADALGHFPSGLGMQMSDAVCLKQKLSSPKAEWLACTADSKTADPKTLPDTSFNLRGVGLQPGYKVFTKIVDTIPGNSDPSEIDYLLAGIAVTGTGAGVTPQHLPAVYRIEVQGEKQENPQEKALLTVLYAY